MSRFSFGEAEMIKASPVKSLARALLASMIFTIIVFVAFSLIIAFTPMSEASADIMVTAATAAAVSVSGFAAAKGAASKGWMWGALGGIAYIVSVWIIGMIASGGFSFNSKTLMALLLSVLIGALGGIVGINMRR
ncbi:MAG: TIGR04086 family membrane protein [Clostridia bacterium]|nr:TIGR04086 family membrane protein [Clostridia bacterium]